MAERSAVRAAMHALPVLAGALALWHIAIVVAATGGDVECAHMSHQFRRISDEEQRSLAVRVREAHGGKQSILVVGGFGGSGTRAWASLFHRVAPDQLIFARGNADWDAGYGSEMLCA